MKDLYIVGAGGFGRELLNLVLDIQERVGRRWNVMGFLDDTKKNLGARECDATVRGNIRDYTPGPNDVLMMGIADPASKRRLTTMLKARGAVFESCIHHFAYLGRHNTIGEGVVIYNGLGMSVNASLGNFVTMLGSVLGHDVSVGDYCTVSACCNIMGGVSLGEGCYLGGNVAIAPKVSVGENAYICTGSVVLKDVPAGAKMMGNPAREIG